MTEVPKRPHASKLQQILTLGRQHWDHSGYDSDARRAFQLALDCKTSALGGRIFGSENEERVFYNTCKSTACSSCGHWATIQWQRQRWCALPDGRYIGINFTMPDTLWPFFAQNRCLVGKLATIAAHVILSYARVRYGIEVGVMPILQTFNGKLEFNPHVHCLVTIGGLQKSGSIWKPSIFFDENTLVRSWQRLVITLLRAALHAGRLESEMTRSQVQDLLRVDEKCPWIGKVLVYEDKAQFLRYGGRYTRRPPIAERRITAIKNGVVCFWHKNKRLNKRRCRAVCTIEDFIDRWAQHILKRYRHAVRHFGLFAPRSWG
jgi:hypothetical protein